VAVTGTIAIDNVDEGRAGEEPTAASAWRALSGSSISDELLAWPPDLFALANVILTDTEAFRFALAPTGEWPPSRCPVWAHAVLDAGHQWGVWVEDRHRELPRLLIDEWTAFRERADVPLEQLGSGHDPRMREALLTLHAIADEACAGLAVALDSSDADGGLYRVRGRELLCRTGSLARLNPRVLRVLPKVSSPPTGRPSFSRYACVRGPGAEARWHKMPARHRGTDIRSEYATLLLLPWPLVVRESDFHALEDSVQRLEKEPFGFFEFAPSEGLDFDLLDRVLIAARKEANSVDIVMLPESAVDEGELDELEALLDFHGVVYLQAGVRQRPALPGRFPRNYMHTGVNPRLEKGGAPDGVAGEAWFHIRQNKHHRWSLDEGQIYQYRLGGALHPRIRWWEAMEVPRRVIEFVEVAELTLVSLVCEDLAQNDDIASLMRSVGPTVVVTVLLDGPQLTSRWSARYASVLADDPGSAVLTLTSFGMVQRSRPHGHDASRVIALWKGPAGGVREIALESGAHAVLLTVCMDRATRRSADGRWPVDNGTYCFDVGVEQIRAAEVGSESPNQRLPTSTAHVLDGEDLTVLTAWAEAIAEALAFAPERLPALFEAARAGAPWRQAFGVPEPCPQLDEAIDAMERALRNTAASSGDPPSFDAVLAWAREDRPRERKLDTLARRVLLAMLEQRRTRQPTARR
jgi:hypothetical protein